MADHLTFEEWGSGFFFKKDFLKKLLKDTFQKENCKQSKMVKKTRAKIYKKMVKKTRAKIYKKML